MFTTRAINENQLTAIESVLPAVELFDSFAVVRQAATHERTTQEMVARFRMTDKLPVFRPN